MLRKSNLSVEVRTFEADLDGITKIQREFIRKARQFCFLRKGEFANAKEIRQSLERMMGNHIVLLILDVAAKVLMGIKGARDIVRLIRRARLNKEKGVGAEDSIVLWIISRRTKENAPELARFRTMGAKVRIISKARSGHIRYFVNESSYCLFLRRGDDDFFGFTGNDKGTIDRLIMLFTLEFASKW